MTDPQEIHDDFGGGDPTEEQYRNAERQLGLVDRVIGLEAEVAELSLKLGHAVTPNHVLVRDVDNLRTELDKVHASAIWKAGTVITLPLRSLKKLVKRSRLR